MKLFYSKKEALEWAFNKADKNQSKYGGFYPIYHEDEEKPWQIVFIYQIRTLLPTGKDRGE